MAPLLVTPTLEEVKLAAAKMGLPEREAEKFFYYYESNGWKVGRVRMASVNGALAGWKLRYEEKMQRINRESEQQQSDDWRQCL